MSTTSMAGEPGTRPLLPQTAQLNYSFVQQPQQPREQQRNYVFVDEHNRHKRLKVMRACDGCRRRKIKCDAATTNTWPCGACTRLKLTCVPPTVSYEKDSMSSHTFEVDDSPQQYRTVDHVQMYPPSLQSASGRSANETAEQANDSFASTFLTTYGPQQYLDLSAAQTSLSSFNAPIVSTSVSDTPFEFPHQQSFHSYQHPAGDLAWNGGDVSPENLTEAMGALSIDHTGIAPYILAQKKNLASSQAVEDYEADLPLPQNISSDSTIRIPPEMFPSEQQALQYFQYFFDNIHPYCPVISRDHFYNQWHTNKDSISPLLLEGIFACSSMALEGHQSGTKWLALAQKHEDSFKDGPRLSTVQAMIVLLKAREAVPKRGYFYRSWMTVVNAVMMGQELDLHEHLDLHRSGQSCGSPPHECSEKQRIWHLLFVLEIMVGGPQARHDFRVDANTCDFSVPTSIPGFNEAEVQISREFAYMARVAENVKKTNLLWYNLAKRKSDWGIDPAFVGHNQDFVALMKDLPRSLQITLPSDGAEPWIPSHFIAQVHCWHYLSVIMHHRPQIRFLSDAGDPGWKKHMLLCCTAAKNMCRVQEAIIHTYGLEALSCMQRGISFTVYAVLTCTMVHLAAITAPDPELNSDAPDFFVRHMRLLEQCVPHWDMPEMHMQIDALREAFSADTSKPFALKSTFLQGSPPAARSSQSPHYQGGSPFDQLPDTSNPVSMPPAVDSAPGQISSNAYVRSIAHPITPPTSITDPDSKTDSPIGQSMVTMSSGPMLSGGPQGITGSPAGVPTEQQAWNPTRIFDQWTAAFAPTPPQPPQTSPSLGGAATRFNPHGPSIPVNKPTSFPAQVQQPSPHGGVQPYSPQSAAAAAAAAVTQSQFQQPQMTGPQLFSPGQWQDLVSSSFQDGGLKRRWDSAYPGVDMSGGGGSGGGMAKRSR